MHRLAVSRLTPPKTPAVRAEPLGFCALLYRMDCIQSALAERYALPGRDPRLQSLLRRAHTASKRTKARLGGLDELDFMAVPSTAVDGWLHRIASIDGDDVRLLAHTCTAHLHDLRVDNLARRVAIMMGGTVPPSATPSPEVGISELLALPVTAREQADAADEMERVVGLQQMLCAELRAQFLCRPAAVPS